MSRKRTKQYLMLLMVIGLVSIAAGGSGTFASFSAETANDGNYFATGSLILNDNGGTTTCTSAASTTSNNINTTSPTGCDTLFTIDKFSTPTASFSAALLGATTLTISSLTAPIYTGDTLHLTDGTNSEDVTAASNAAVGDTSVDVSATTNAYGSGGTLTDNNPTYFANLTLTNAGTIDASGIKFSQGAAGCSDSTQEPQTTLDTGGNLTAGSAVTSLTVVAIPSSGASAGVGLGYKAGQPVVVKSGTHYQTFIVSTDAAPADTTISVDSQDANFSYPVGSTVRGPEFGTPTLCNHLKFSIVESPTSSFGHDASSKADGCAYGTVDPSNASTGVGCLYGDAGNDFLDTVPTGLTDLTLKNNGGLSNTGTKLSKSGGTRYFVLAVHFDGTSFTNAYQNRAASAFDLIWHIDQA